MYRGNPVELGTERTQVQYRCFVSHFRYEETNERTKITRVTSVDELFTFRGAGGQEVPLSFVRRMIGGVAGVDVASAAADVTRAVDIDVVN